MRYRPQAHDGGDLLRHHQRRGVSDLVCSLDRTFRGASEHGQERQFRDARA
jgi:hypothetical protein